MTYVDVRTTGVNIFVFNFDIGKQKNYVTVDTITRYMNKIKTIAITALVIGFVIFTTGFILTEPQYKLEQVNEEITTDNPDLTHSIHYSELSTEEKESVETVIETDEPQYVEPSSLTMPYRYHVVTIDDTQHHLKLTIIEGEISLLVYVGMTILILGGISYAIYQIKNTRHAQFPSGITEAPDESEWKYEPLE